LTNKWNQLKKMISSGDVKPWDLLNPSTEYATEEEAKSRFSICEGCPKFSKMTKRCLECGCFMELKTKLKQASCPMSKW